MRKFLLLIILAFSQNSYASFEDKLVEAALFRTTQQIVYDGSYHSIPYPNGDVPSHIGVCTDVVIRSYRAVGVDLQKLVHEDISAHFNDYPSKRIWGLNKPDRNIDHRRVPNLQSFFSRQGITLKISQLPTDYTPGDIVTWMLPGNLPHIGIITDRISKHSGNPLVAHNIGAGPVLDDMLFTYEITGHFRYIPETYQAVSQGTNE
ncbi:DUF1287 domain-containing protein [Microbulbifer sp. 2201CG32-9]|uniref:DUF1287 domain-containing protein n=1 Tax=unclassified Microbulbifer TaxID=2619833 RepID=UPI00345BC8A6